MMKRKIQKRDFIIKDLMISVSGGKMGDVWLPAPGGETPPSPISPVAGLLVKMGLVDTVRGIIREALKSEEGIESIGQAFVQGGVGGNPVIRNAINEIGAAVVASAAYAAMPTGKFGIPNPDCGGTSYETIPPTITPIIVTGREIHRVTELPRLQNQLAATMEYIEKATETRLPAGEEVGMLRDKIEGAFKNVG